MNNRQADAKSTIYEENAAKEDEGGYPDVKLTKEDMKRFMEFPELLDNDKFFQHFWK